MPSSPPPAGLVYSALKETGERSDLVLYPARSLAPGEMFLVRIAPSGSVPLAVKRTVPSRITPVMDLG